MIKGMSRRVIMVQSPDPELFENAIFILRNDAFDKGTEPEDVLKQAQQIADEYVRTNLEKKKHMRSPLIYALAGALAGGGILGLMWLLI
ncbi:MAG: hypothetical protein IKA58_04775 [Clostridia bacterium]|nr:hypothetical protein [Clostridia bacterium]MBR6654159.1 hypothetical protein [Oscillospiraceae bacterium]